MSELPPSTPPMKTSSGLSAVAPCSCPDGHQPPHSTRSYADAAPTSTPFERIAKAILFGVLTMLLSAANGASLTYISTEGRITAVDRTTGTRSVASGYNLGGAGKIAISPTTGRIFVADQGDRAIYEVDPRTGYITMLSGPGAGTGPNFSGRLFGIAIEATGTLVVADGDSSGGLLALVRVDPATGDRTILSAGSNSGFPVGSGRPFLSPFEVVVESSGQILVTDYLVDALIRVDPLSGNRSVISGDPFGDNVGSGPDMNGPAGLTLENSLSVIIAESPQASFGSYDVRFVRVNLTNGSRTVLSSPHLGGSPVYGVATAPDGRTLAAYSRTVNYVATGGTLLSISSVDGTTVTLSGSDGDFGQSTKGAGPIFLVPIDVKVKDGNTYCVSDERSHSLFLIDRLTGNRNIIPNSRTGNGAELYRPRGAAIQPDALFVIDRGTSQTDRSNNSQAQPLLLRIDRATGYRTIVSAGSNTSQQLGSGPNFSAPAGMIADSDGTLILADAGRIIGIDPASGNRAIISGPSTGSGTALSIPYAVSLGAAGNLFVTDQSQNALFKIDRISGDRFVISSASQGSGTTFSALRGVASAAGAIYVTDSSHKAVFQVDSTTGDRTLVSSSARGNGISFSEPSGIAIEDDGHLLVLDSTLNALIRVELLTGNRMIVSNDDTGSGVPLRATGEKPEFFAIGDGSPVTTRAPTIIAQPLSATVSSGSDATFTVEAVGTFPLSYEWQRKPSGGSAWVSLSDNATFSGTATATLAIENATNVLNGEQYQCVVSNGFNPNAISHAVTLTINSFGPVAEPTIFPNGGSFANSVQVTLACGTSGATIRYTTDGSIPGLNSSDYLAPFTLTSSKTVNVRAFKVGYDDSVVATANLIVRSGTPVISPNGGTFSSSVEVTMTCSTAEAEIRFTTDGSAPDTRSALFAGAITLTNSTVIKAKAFKSGIADSDIATANFAVNYAAATAGFTGILNVTSTAPGYGSISLRTTARGAITGKAWIDGRALPFSGKLSLSGGFTKVFKYRVNGVLVQATLVLQLASDGMFGGSFIADNGVSFEITGEKNGTGTKSLPSASAGKYSAHLTAQDITPGGGPVRGYLLITVGVNGATTLVGALPDGEKLSGSSHVSERGNLPILFGLNKGRLGYLSGSSTVSGIADSRILTGDLVWSKSAQTAAVSKTNIGLAGHVWTKPATGARLVPDFDANSGNMLVTFSAGNLNPNITKVANITAKNVVAVTPTTSERLVMRLTPGTGLFTGSFRQPDGVTRKFSGVFVQNHAGPSIVQGFFLGGTVPGLVTIIVP